MQYVPGSSVRRASEGAAGFSNICHGRWKKKHSSIITDGVVFETLQWKKNKNNADVN